jgi:hypothetical protein
MASDKEDLTESAAFSELSVGKRKTIHISIAQSPHFESHAAE